jgi:hypothetical protein
MRNVSSCYLLTHWGIWTRIQAGIGGYVCPTYALMRDNVATDQLPTPAINDAEAMWVDRMLSVLRERDRDCFNAVWHYYRFDGLTYRKLGLLLGCTHMKAAELVKSGESWLDGRMSAVLEAA